MWLAAIPGLAAEPAELALYVFKAGKPVSDAQISVDARVSGSTNRNGAIYLDLPEGRHDLAVGDGQDRWVELDLQTVPGENLQIIVELPVNGGSPTVDIESSQQGQTRRQAVDESQPQEQGPQGEVVGQVTDVETGEAVAGARIFISGVSLETETDENGRFNLEVPPGEYAMSVIHSDYSTQTMERLVVKPKEPTEADMELSPAGIELADFVVTAPYIEGSIASVVSQQRETSEVTEVIGAEQMSRSGDSDAADALQRVSGLTLDQGKYVVIRGQPSRYTSTVWNGSPLPSPDPIRRIVPLDLFPTGVLSGVQVQKSYSADRQGSFGAGMINLQTKSIPEKGFFNVDVGVGYNSQTTGKDGKSSEGGSLDFLGMDDGTRALPDAIDARISGGQASLNDVSNEERSALGATFSNNYHIANKTVPPNAKFGFAGGSSFATRWGEFGILTSFSWDRKFHNREETDTTFALSEGELLPQGEMVEDRTDMNVDLGGLFVLGWEVENHELSGNFFIIRNLTERNQITEGVDADNNVVKDHLIEWNERQMIIGQLVGHHDFSFMQFDWRALKAKGDRSSPDRRTYSYLQSDGIGDFVFRSDTGANRRFNEVDDKITGLGADFTLPLIDKDKLAWKMKIGGAYDKQDRESFISRFRFEPDDSLEQELLLQPNPESFLTPDKVLSGEIDFFDDSQANEDYEGTAEVVGGYAMTDVEFFSSLRLVGGVRVEQSDFTVFTFQGGADEGEIEGGFEETDLLPAFTATYKFLEDMQVRFGYSQTVSRPVLVELSASRYFDPQQSDDYRGNPDLKPAQIESFDVRWEWYPSATESLTFGGFAKYYTDPIEIVLDPQGGGSSVLRTLTNANEATVFGIEGGGRVELGRFAEMLDKFYLQANATFLTSEVELSEGGINTSASRPLAGQAENVYNGQLGYDGEDHDITLTFNRVGRRLETAGANQLPDIFREPESYLNLTYGWQFVEKGELKFKASNLLNPEIKFSQGGKTDRIYQRGVTLSTSIKWSFM